MTNKILFIFEGEKSEVKLWEIINRHYPLHKTCFITAFANSIYDLHSIVNDDPDLDMVEVIRERSSQNKSKLSGIGRGQISEIYLFFDFDCHDPKSEHTDLADLIRTFSDEHDKGRIFISYPMLESHRHCKKYDAVNFLELTVKKSEISRYKETVNNEGHFQQFRKCKKPEIDWLMRLHLIKATQISTGNKSFQSTLKSISQTNQLNIYFGQKKFYLDANESVATLGSFPNFLYYYRGEDFLVDIDVNVNLIDFPTSHSTFI